jgi:hypothetical protein
VVHRAWLTAAAALLVAGCHRPPPEPLQLDGAVLTVYNRTGEDWSSVAIWLNHQFRITTPRIAAHTHFQVPLGLFVEGYGRRFDFSRMKITDLRLRAMRPGGEVLEMVKRSEKGGLAGVLQAMGGKKQ